MNKIEWRSYYREQRVLRNEVWRDIPGYEGLYKASTLGRIKSLNYMHTYKENILRPCTTRHGYVQVLLYKGGKSKRHLIHRIIAQVFIKNIENKPQVNHINGIKNDNIVHNLEWVDASENASHAYKYLGRKPSGGHKGEFGHMHNSAKKVVQFTKDNIFIKEWGSIVDAYREIRVHKSDISSCCHGKLKSAGGYIWRFK